MLIVGLIHFGEDSLAVTQDPEDKELRALLTSRRDALHDALKAVLANQGVRFPQGSGESSEHADLIMELMNVDLELSRTKEERIAITEAILALIIKREEYQEAQIRAGLDRTSAMLITKANRLKVEIELHKARKAP